MVRSQIIRTHYMYIGKEVAVTCVGEGKPILFFVVVFFSRVFRNCYKYLHGFPFVGVRHCVPFDEIKKKK